ncbi:hypothetical protein CYMTET_13445 [Cymbomonas tetramitiformis]|uniref:Uncharacterized protein n=1 Tax=Cymbomonas tetramitiformis TaxID=36881 RepID=A0AAE0GI46_9CHLO|nr:hypothetical protein CYMTET_13445 [Cymbomonas tetramitiformis]
MPYSDRLRSVTVTGDYLRPTHINGPKVGAIYSAVRHRGWAKRFCSDVLGGKDKRLTASGNLYMLPGLVVAIKNEFDSVGLDMAVFNLDNPTVAGIPCLNELLYYDVLKCIIKRNSVAHTMLLG